MTIAAIVVTDLNNAIGKDNKLLCHLPADLKFFKSTTMGCPIIMGRKTYESIGRLLPGRKNIIITRNTNYRVEGSEIFTSIEHCLENLKEVRSAGKEDLTASKADKIFIIGGAEIYKQTHAFTDEIYRTLIQNKFDADVFYPNINVSEFTLVWEEKHQKDEKNLYDYTFQKFVRK